MDTEKNKYETTSQQKAGEPGSASATAQKVLDRGAEVYGQAEKAVSDVYDKTAQAASKTYEQAKSYSSENPGKTILIAVGIGVGLGFLLGVGASSRRSRTGRYAEPVVNALSDIAMKYFR
jgi:ElaB/YqjD/DUF883 family membrane-anchored ribosome-binding protein